MKGYILKKIITAPLLFLITVCIIFCIVHLAPGDPASFFFSDFTAPPGAYEQMREQFGLDKPIHEQFLIYVRNIFTGNWGFSFKNNLPVFDLIVQRLSATLELVLTAFVLSVVLGVILGINAASSPYSKKDNILTILSLVVYSTPQFWIGLVLLIIFGVNLRWFPIAGRMTAGLTGLAAIFDRLHRLILPTSVLALSNLALYFRLTRASMLEQIRSDYIMTARAKGCNSRRIYYYHALRNALLPIVTIVTMHFPWIVAGAILVETVFSWPGLGMLLYNSIFIRDYNVIMAIYATAAALVISFSIIGDIVYAFVDPRIRFK